MFHHWAYMWTNCLVCVIYTVYNNILIIVLITCELTLLNISLTLCKSKQKQPLTVHTFIASHGVGAVLLPTRKYARVDFCHVSQLVY